VQFGIEIEGDWTPPEPVLSVPMSLVTDVIEVQVFDTSGTPMLAGAVELARVSPADAVPLEATLYAVAYRPAGRNGQTRLDIWPGVLAVGQPLPTLPLWLRGGLHLPLELEATCERTCQEQRVPILES
jgi:hypothetical protein